MANPKFLITLVGIIAAVLVWSGIGPYDQTTWLLEVAPVLIAFPLLFLTYKKFPLTTLLYGLIAAHMVILMIGGHYTYARVPFMEFLGEGRNNYDKIGHFAQGFIPAMVIRELLLRTSPLKPGKWLFALVVFSCLGISAVYELIEWIVAIIVGQGANEFLGSQGDVWTRKKT
jgi:putative membrane protein